MKKRNRKRVDRGIFSDEYIQEVNAAYWAEEDEFRLGIHPTQVKERIVTWFKDHQFPFRSCPYTNESITYLDWKEDHKVGVYIDHQMFGIFDYDVNDFTTLPKDCENDPLFVSYQKA